MASLATSVTRSSALAPHIAGRVKVHDLPKYTPDTKPIERVWWRLHEAVTRDHRCHTMEDLLDLTFDWFKTHTTSESSPRCTLKILENEAPSAFGGRYRAG